MASCKFDGGKCHGAGDVKAALRHNDITPEMRAVAAHGNPDIDLAKSGLNVRLYGGSYTERCEKYDARIAELDAVPGANVRKDRVTGQLIETPVPKGLPRSQYNAWMRRVVEIQLARYGAENMIAADGHWDEEHKYTGEHGQPEMSRVHVQTVVVPVVDGRLCGKEFFSRKQMRELNDAVQSMSRDEFGVDFLDGTKKKGKKSTEQLKAESAAKAAEAAQRAAEAIRAAAKEDAARLLREASEALQEAERLQKQAKAAIAAGDAYQQTARALRSDDQALIDYMQRCKYDTGKTVYDTMRDRMVASQQRKQAAKRPAASRAEAMRELDRLTAGLQQQADGRSLDF